MNHLRNISQKEDGYVLVVALLVMAILSLLGIAGIHTSTFEMQVAGNDWNAKRTFYKADGGISLGSELIEQSFNCANGFTPTGTKIADIEGTIRVQDRSDIILPELAPWFNPEFLDTDTITIENKLKNPRDYYDAAFLSNSTILPATFPVQDVGYLFFGGTITPEAGSSFLSQAGYLGIARSAAHGGLSKTFKIYSQYIGMKNSESIIVAGWRHLLGTEENCKY